MVEAIDAQGAELTIFYASVEDHCQFVGVPNCLDVHEDPVVEPELRDVCTAAEIRHEPPPEEGADGKRYVPVGADVYVTTDCSNAVPAGDASQD